MLDQEKLYNSLLKTFQDSFPTAFEQALYETFPMKTERGTEMAKQFGETISYILADPMARGIAGAVDSYIQGIEITSTFMSTPCSPGTPLMFQLKHMGNRQVTNGIGQSGMGPTGMGAISVK